MKVLSGKLKERIRRQDVLLAGCLMDSRSGAAVEMFHALGYDLLLIDREHTLLGDETILEHIRLSRALELPCMVRLSGSDDPELGRILDQAPDGIFVPRIRNRAEVEEVLRRARHAPLGQRGMGASTCPAGQYLGWPSLREQAETANSRLVIGIQIETTEALDQLDGILSVEGIDVALVGNDDLSLSLGIPGQFAHPRYLEAVTRVIASCQKHGVLPGIACGDPARLRFWKDLGMRMFWTAADVCLMWEGARRLMKGMQEALEAPLPPPFSSEATTSL